MADTTGIEWTDHTFNPWWGCSRVSPACAHCYADTNAKRYGMPGLWEDGGERRFFSDTHWDKPLVWNRNAERKGEPKLVFCASMADVFEEHPVLDEHRVRLWALIEKTPWLTWQLLTKRPENVLRFAPWDEWPENVWVGTSIENARWTHRADYLREIPCRLRFLSCEPVLGSLFVSGRNKTPLNLNGIGWVIVGGESGPGFRPMHPDWAREIRNACLETRELERDSDEHTLFFFKQWSGPRPKSHGKVLDGREWCEIPEPHTPALALF